MATSVFFFVWSDYKIQGSKYRTAGRRSWWPAKYFLVRTNPNFGQSNNEYYRCMIFFSGLWKIVLLYWCSGFWQQVGEKFIHTFLSSFFAVFAHFQCPLYLEYHRTAVSEDLSSLPGSSNICISVKLNLFGCLAGHHLIFSAKKLIWREICSTNSVFIIRINKYTAELSFGSSCNFIAKDSLTSSKIYIMLFTQRRILSAEMGNFCSWLA